MGYLGNFKWKIRERLKKHDKLYVLSRCIADMRYQEYIDLIKGYYEGSYHYSVILARRNDEILYDERPIYHVLIFERKDERNTARDATGFCASLRWTLEYIYFADIFHLIPVIEWGKSSAYYEEELNATTSNVFEYYFEPVSGISSNEIVKYGIVIRATNANRNFAMKHASDSSSYEVEQEEIQKLACVYKKYVHLNRKTKEYIKENLSNLLGERQSVLGVHFRGTDFSLNLVNHPIAASVEESILQTKELLAKNNYDKIFLATDDLVALEKFQQEFGDDLLYYADVLRTQGNTGIHNTSFERSLHHYKLGLEVLRDVYTLACCDSLICGLSQVSFAARFVNFALNRDFKEVVIIDHGIRRNDT